MNATNPFQVPTWAQINSEQRRRERFKKTVIIILAAAVLLLIGLLIEGCKTERDTMSTPKAFEATALDAVPSTPAIPQAQAAVAPTVSQAHPVSQRSPVSDTAHSMTVYVVKSGDTLSRIAKAHRTTIEAIQAANGLNGDQILVGAKLKVPEA
ncbi:MAG TPA: LysM peptidoglycan-binding domain-containing protein [Candidatus Saccharimonadales bacterium]|nr:LysM peptidoglycan-binding domain-containing protein [Candidatus Saccharimonadales bacterium]